MFQNICFNFQILPKDLQKPEKKVGDLRISPNTVEVNPTLSDLKGPGTSKLDWRYFEHHKVDCNELQIRKMAQEQKWLKNLNNFEKFDRKKYQIHPYA